MYEINDRTDLFASKLSKNYSLLIVDDDPFFRKALITFFQLSNQGKIRDFSLLVIGEAEDSGTAVQMASQQQPEIILLDLCLGENKKDGIETLIELKKSNCLSKILVLSASRRNEYIFQAMQVGALGYVVKDNVTAQLTDAIETIIQGNVYLPPEVATSFFDVFHAYFAPEHHSETKFALTERETEVLTLLVKGNSNRKIAEQLFVTVATVKAHLTSIFHKLEVKNRSQAIVKALKLDLVH